jgi:hypothetical protein
MPRQDSSNRTGDSDGRVRSGEGVGSVMREMNNRISQQQQQPQDRRAEGKDSSSQESDGAE